jgi:hypothetical protein
MAEIAAITAVLPIGGAAILVARRVGGAGAVEAASVHHRKPVGLRLIGAVAGHIDARRINLYWDVDNQVHLDVLGWVLVVFAAAVPIVLLLLEVKLGDNTFELRETGGVRRAVGQALLERLVEPCIVELSQGTVVVAALVLILLETQAVLSGSALALTNFAQLSTRQLLYADDREAFLEHFYCIIPSPIERRSAIPYLFAVRCGPIARFSFHEG